MCRDTRSFDASGASFLCSRPELLYVRRDTVRYAELRFPIVPVVDGDDDYDSDADVRRRREREDGEQEVPLRELQQQLQPQGRSDLSSEIRVSPGSAIQMPILRLLRPAHLERASTRAEMPFWSGHVHDRPAAATRPLRPEAATRKIGTVLRPEERRLAKIQRRQFTPRGIFETRRQTSCEDPPLVEAPRLGRTGHVGHPGRPSASTVLTSRT